MELRKLMAAVVAAGLVGSAGAAAAADAIVPGANPVEYTTPSGWTFTIAPYGWLSGI